MRETQHTPGDFWSAIDTQLTVLAAHGTTAAKVCQILPPIPGLSAGNADGFFAGSGGGVQVSEVLREKGWKNLWAAASYHWCMQAPDGSCLTYIEGDLYLGNQR